MTIEAQIYSLYFFAGLTFSVLYFPSKLHALSLAAIKNKQDKV
jgi:hypothetical protein